MTDILDRPVEGAANWKGPELAGSTDWIYTLTDEDVAEIDAALAHVRSKRLKIPAITRRDFPLPKLGAKLAAILEEIEHGRGFVLMRGLPVERLGEADATAAYWGIGTWFGEVAPQNMMGELLGHVRAIGGDWNRNFNIRGYQTTVHLPFHCDKSDMVGLLCLQTAKAGGASCIASSVAIHDEILRTRPDLLEALYQDFCIDHRGEQFDGEAPYYVAPVFAVHKGRFFARFGQKYVESAQRFPDVPRLTAAQVEAMDLFSKLALSDEFRLDMIFERGDMQFLNNHLIVHSRDDYEDRPEPERRRHLLRMLLFTEANRDVPDFVRNLNAFIRRWGRESRESVLAAAGE
jgi:hypothetical protein